MVQMETNFNFKSQICTDKIQSERLLSLGLKRETADMSYTAIVVNHKVDYRLDCSTPKSIDIPAWSLHRLIEMMPNELMYNGQLYRLRIDMGDQLVGYFPHPYRLRSAALEYFYGNDTIYDDCISCIEWLIKEGYFNKEYLV